MTLISMLMDFRKSTDLIKMTLIYVLYVIHVHGMCSQFKIAAIYTVCPQFKMIVISMFLDHKFK